ncbi:hypothetical protein MACH24_02960 [Erythrobacter sp. Dej080120_24]|nr:hypothetical protein MACH24_02960 [Erythrobacter sp. Dej080120_24]
MQARAIVARDANVKRGLKVAASNGNGFRMSEGQSNKMSREERMAAKLRENLRRRKTQSRQLKAESPDNGVSKDDCES